MVANFNAAATALPSAAAGATKALAQGCLRCRVPLSRDASLKPGKRGVCASRLAGPASTTGSVSVRLLFRFGGNGAAR